MLMDGLFRLSDLENRFPLNLNVLDAHRTPRVLSLRECLAQWVDHQFVVLVRRSEHRLQRIADRLELLGGYLIAYLNLDRVIAIIRTEDEPKPVMIAEFALTDRQAEAILNMRLCSLRRLEEMELKREQDALTKEGADLQALLASPPKQKARLKRDMKRLRDKYGPETVLGRRRTEVAEAAPARDIPLEAMIEREPITVILSQRGWIRTLKGHLELAGAETLKFKEGDGPAFAFHAQTTDKLLLAAANGRFYTLAADRLPGGRGFGEPVRALIDLDGSVAIVRLLKAPTEKEGRGSRLLVASSDGRGFVVPVADVLAETRKGKTVMTPRPDQQLRLVRIVAPAHDYVAAIGDNREDAGLPAGRTGRDEPRAGAAAAAVPRRRAGGRDDVHARRRAELADGRRQRAGADRGRYGPVAHRARGGGPDARRRGFHAITASTTGISFLAAL